MTHSYTGTVIHFPSPQRCSHLHWLTINIHLTWWRLFYSCMLWASKSNTFHCHQNCSYNDGLNYIYLCIWLSAKRCTNGGSDFLLSIKSVSNTLSCCCFVCAFIIGQHHSGNNMSSKSGAAGEILFFESEKRHEIRPLKTDTLTVSTFDAFIHVHDESKHYLSHRFAQRRYCFTQCI